MNDAGSFIPILITNINSPITYYTEHSNPISLNVYTHVCESQNEYKLECDS